MSTPKQQTARTYIGLGSNLEDREAHLRAAIASLHEIGSLKKISSIYETEPLGTIPQPDFLNAVVELQTALPPEQLLAALLHIEQNHGRDRSAGPPKGPRTLDLDLLAYDDRVMETPTLALPHPALAERPFVLVPLAEIAPEWRHPVSGKTASELLAELSQGAAQLADDRPHFVRKLSRALQSS